MLFFYILFENYERGEDHPIWQAIVKWFACFVATAIAWAAVIIALMLVGAAIGS